MTDGQRKDNYGIPGNVASIVMGLPWLEALARVWKPFSERVSVPIRGLYEVLEYEPTLERKDRVGEKAIFTKREKMCCLQDNVIAYQDQGRGDVDILLSYHCSPGVPVDRYRSGHWTRILIPRSQVRNK